MQFGRPKNLSHLTDEELKAQNKVLVEAGLKSANRLTVSKPLQIKSKAVGA